MKHPRCTAPTRPSPARGCLEYHEEPCDECTELRIQDLEVREIAKEMFIREMCHNNDQHESDEMCIVWCYSRAREFVAYEHKGKPK